MNDSYEDIIHLPHHISPTRSPMSLDNRAAQFSPFAALTGHGDAIKETARITDKRIHLAEDSQAHLARKFDMLAQKESCHPKVSITYFQPDDPKEGGYYETITDSVKKIDNYEHTIVLENEQIISLDEIVEIESDVFISDHETWNIL